MYKQFGNINKNAEKIAYSILKQLQKATLDELVSWVEDSFMCRINIRSYNGKASGLVYFDPGIEAYRIFVKQSDIYERKRFTICHEIGHILSNHMLQYGLLNEGGFESKNNQERFCNRFAAVFLMPVDSFVNKWNTILETHIEIKIYRMAKYFEVSRETIRYRAKELELIQ